MKKYLFGLGAMLVGAGLMFVLMHGEVSAESENRIECESFFPGAGHYTKSFAYCKIKDLTCVSANNGLSCVKN
jgi:hypothetical protein